MREIKFRGLRTDGKGWVYGYYFYDRYTELHYIIDDTSNVEVKSETVGQFTGLKDKSDVDIYEGDLLSDRYEDEGEEYESMLPIVWCSKKLQWRVDVSFARDSTYLVSMVDYFGKHLEIKGNIHENNK